MMNAYQSEEFYDHAARELERHEIAVTVEHLQAYARLHSVRMSPEVSLMAAEYIAACYQ